MPQLGSWEDESYFSGVMERLLQGKESYASGKISDGLDLQAALLVAGYICVAAWGILGEFKMRQAGIPKTNSIMQTNKPSSSEAETLAAIF